MKRFSQTLASLLLCALALPTFAIAAGNQTTEQHGNPVLQLKAQKAPQVTTQGYQSYAWFHSVNLTLSGDINNNGYFHRLEVEFDADTSESYLQVFAEYTLLPSYGDERIYYTSSVFELYRESADDWLAIDTVLEDSFAADDYLLTIRLFDAATGYMIAEISGFDDANLDYLALEDYASDRYIPVTSTVEVHGGSTGMFWLIALCLILGIRYHVQSRRS